MLIDFVLNISITISGIYLFHRLQYLEDRRIIDSDIFQALLMTTLSVLLLMVPIEIQGITFSLYFIPLLILVKYSVPYLMIISVGIVFLFHHLIFNFDWQPYLVFLILYVLIMLVLPFLNFQKLKELTAAVIMFTALYGLNIHLFIQPLTLFQVTIFILASTIVMFFAMMMYEDINKILGLLKRYEEEEYKDFLTQLGNVKALDNSVEEMLDKSSTVSLLLVDIDNFSLINEQHSHASGDALIRQMASLLNNYVPNGGMLFRSSGEEFSMITPDLSFDKTVRLAEALRNSVERAHFHISDRETVHLTVSIGIAYQAVSSDTKGMLFKEADDMLHAAKKYGQNRVMFNPI
ncbi:GGDEF domain-containing protein [Salinicoccus hispanicus]|uniref:Diguanylate cyclase n=1 Tax=Salinicoccus hispanicus TaxID=157225 RepID=A0A6N8U2V7_9STAP|nr:GGDEF domain-containing protein [Salinicoccus hispanicus]MXQ50725.1 diguanylate cyclase [Salinicoccus hispanicus]